MPTLVHCGYGLAKQSQLHKAQVLVGWPNNDRCTPHNLSVVQRGLRWRAWSVWCDQKAGRKKAGRKKEVDSSANNTENQTLDRAGNERDHHAHTSRPFVRWTSRTVDGSSEHGSSEYGRPTDHFGPTDGTPTYAAGISQSGAYLH